MLDMLTLGKFDHTIIWSGIWLHEYVHIIFMNTNCLQDLMIERSVCLLEGHGCENLSFANN
jgi:hypothetical protein